MGSSAGVVPAATLLDAPISESHLVAPSPVMERSIGET